MKKIVNHINTTLGFALPTDSNSFAARSVLCRQHSNGCDSRSSARTDGHDLASLLIYWYFIILNWFYHLQTGLSPLRSSLFLNTMNLWSNQIWVYYRYLTFNAQSNQSKFQKKKKKSLPVSALRCQNDESRMTNHRPVFVIS